MSLTRPAYTFTVENRTQGWTYTTTEGPDPDPDAPVKLLDNMTHKWGFAQDRIPGPFEPATLSFRLGADRVGDLPTVHINDVILARLDRAEPIEYAWTGAAEESVSIKSVGGTVATKNLAPTPRLEDSTAGWSFSSADESHPDGTYTRLTATTATSARMTIRTQQIGLYCPVEPNTVYQLSWDYRASKSVTVGIRWRDTLGSIINLTTYPPSMGGSGTWERLSHQFVSPANAAAAQILIGNGEPWSVGEHFDLRRVRFDLASNPDPIEYFDGDTPDEPANSYFTFGGRVTDPVVALDPHAAKPAQMTVTAVEFLTDLANVFPSLPENHAPDYPDDPWSFEIYYDLFSYSLDFLVLKVKDRLRTLLPAAWRQTAPPDWTGSHGVFELSKDHSSVDVGEMLGRIAASKPIEYAPGVRYTAYPRARWHETPPVPADTGTGWYPLDTESRPEGIFPGWFIDELVPSPNPNPMPTGPGVWYWITPISRHLGSESAVLTLVWPAGDPYATAAVADDAEELDGLIYLDACNVRTPLSARKGREHVVDRVNINGVDRITRSSGSTSTDQLETIAENYPPAATADAPVARAIDTVAMFSLSIYLDGAPQPWINESFRFIVDEIGPTFLSDASVNSQQWSFDSIDVTTWTMTDDELDRIAPQFFPEEPTADVLYPRVLTQLIVDGIDPDVLTDPPFLNAVVTGATHTITGGRLLIKPNLVGGVLPVNPTTTDAVTAADLTAAGSPWSDLLTAETIDPNLTALDFRLIGEPA